jgi:hypothetical protein
MSPIVRLAAVLAVFAVGAAALAQEPAKPAQRRSFTFIEDPQAGPPIAVSIELPKRQWHIGETFSFTITATRPCHFLVYTIDADGRVELHDPKVSGAFMGAPVLTAGERRQIPVAGAPGRARIDPPSGRYEIGAVCSLAELEQVGLGAAALRQPARRGRRSFVFQVEEAAKAAETGVLARVTVAYEVR